MYCVKCGNKLNEGSNFCSQCGFPVDKEFNVKSIKEPENLNNDFNEFVIPEPKVKKASKPVIITAIVLTVASISLMAVSICMNISWL